MNTDIHFYDISLSSSYNDICFREMLYRKSKHTFRVQERFFKENRAVCEIMWKNIVKLARSQMAI